MQMWTSRSACRADSAQNGSWLQKLAYRTIDFRKMSVPSAEVIVVGHDNYLSIASHPSGKNNDTRLRHNDRRSPGSTNILPSVKLKSFPSKGVVTLSKTVSQRAADGPA